MDVEMLVLGADEGLLDQGWDLVDRHIDAAFLRKFVDQAAFAGIDAADGLGRILRQLFMAGQVARIHPENRPQSQGDKKGCGDDPGKDRAEEGQKKTEQWASLWG